MYIVCTFCTRNRNAFSVVFSCDNFFLHIRWKTITNHHPIELRAPKLIEMVGATTPSQAWAILSRHARDDIAPLRLKDLCTDNDRITSLVTVHSGSQNARDRFVTSAKNTNSPLRQMNRTLIADFSRQRMTLALLDTWTHGNASLLISLLSPRK